MGKELKVDLNKLTSYPVLGKGVYGKVYKLNNRICVKVNKDLDVHIKEVELYKRYENCSLFPKYYDSGENYIIMELIKGNSLRVYLDEGKVLNENICKQLVKMFEEGYQAGLMLNPNARHIILTSVGRIRLVDIEDINKFSSARPFMLFNRLNKTGQKQAFLEYVKSCHKWLFDLWNSKKN